MLIFQTYLIRCVYMKMDPFLVFIGIIFVVLFIIYPRQILAVICLILELFFVLIKRFFTDSEPIHDEFNERTDYWQSYVRRGVHRIKLTEKERIENKIFDRSLDLISESKPYYNDVKERYRKEYNTSEDGRIDWHKVFINDFTRVKGTAYVPAIDLIARLMPEIDWRQKIIINSLVNKLVEIRVKQNERHKNMPENEYEEHQYVIDAWLRFKSSLYRDIQ